MTHHSPEQSCLTQQFDTENFLYHAVAVWNDGGTAKVVKINVIPAPRDEAQHFVDSIRRLQREGMGDFKAIADVSLQRVNIPLTATDEDRIAAWWSHREYRYQMMKHDAWLLSHYRLRVLDSEALDPEEALMIQLRALQRRHEERRAVVVEVALEWADAHAAAVASDEIPTYLAHEMKRQAFTGFAPGGC